MHEIKEGGENKGLLDEHQAEPEHHIFAKKKELSTFKMEDLLSFEP